MVSYSSETSEKVIARRFFAEVLLYGTPYSRAILFLYKDCFVVVPSFDFAQDGEHSFSQ
jgi:hypothetical protein